MDYAPTSSSPSFPNARPFFGTVENTIHALRLVQAARQGIIPRIIRRLNDSERREMITSGAVFVFSVEESGIKRWTDSMVWSPSRIVGNFLVYKEMCERSGGRTGQKKAYALEEQRAPRPHWNEQGALQYEGSSGPTMTNGSFKVNGLIKKTITVTIDGSDLHLISYYTQDDLQSRRLRRISSRPDIANLELQPQLFRLSSFRNPPKIVTGRNGRTNIVCEPEEPELLEGFMAESQDPAGYSAPDWSDGVEGNTTRQALVTSHSAQLYLRGRGATAPSGQFRKDGLQGQFDSQSMPPHEDRGEFYWPSAAPSEIQRPPGQVGHWRSGDSQPQQQESWPQPAQPLTTPRYGSMPPQFSSYHHRSQGGDSERDARSGDHTTRGEHATMYGSSPHYFVAQDRHVGYNQPTWPSANQDAVHPSSYSGIQNPLAPPGSSPPNNSSFTVMHSEGDGAGIWSSSRNDGESYPPQYTGLEPGSEPFSNATHSPTHNYYGS